jgi:hypothetical protein
MGPCSEVDRRLGDATLDMPVCQPSVSGDRALSLVFVGPSLFSGRLIVGPLVGVLSELVVCSLLLLERAMLYVATPWLAGRVKLLVGGRIL